MQTTERKISELIPAEYNPRQLSDKQHEDLKASLTRFGAVDPAIVNIHPDRKDIIVGGHQRLKVAKSLGWETFPCVEVNLTRDQERELNVRLNKNTGSWDWNILGDLFQAEELKEWGFSDEELFGNIEVEEAEAQEDNYEIPDEIKTDIVLGDLIEIGEHRLLCGDSTDSDEVAKLMNGEKADMVFTDPPYNVAFNGRSGKFDVIENDDLPENEFESLIDGFVSIINILKPRNYYVWCNWKFYGLLQSKLEFKACIVWAKNVFGLGRGYRHQHEFCLFNGKIDEGINNESDLWEVKKDTNYLHPTQKPIELASRALNNHKKDNLIVDLFSGSGLTFIASHQLKRKCYGMELDTKYCQVIIDRMLKLDESLEVKINGNPYVKNTDNT